MMTRRSFMGTLAAVTAVVGTGLGTLLARRRVAVKGIGPDLSAEMEGRSVTLRSPEGEALSGTVTEIRTVRTRSGLGAPATEQVSMMVKPGTAVPVAGNYQVETDDLVLDSLYFSPVGAPGKDRRLEAVITRIV